MINSLEPVAQEHALLKRVEDAVFLLVGAQGSYPDGEAAEERAFMQLPVLFVMSDLCVCGNGLAVSARRMTMLLGEWRHDARVLSAPPCHRNDCGGGAPVYPLPHLRIPLVAPLIASQGYALARVDRRQVDRVFFA